MSHIIEPGGSMLTTSDLLAAAKRGAAIPSNYRLARVMGLSDNTVFRWSSGAGAPDDLHAARLAEMAGLDVEYVVASMKAAREKDPELRAIWARMAERLARAPGAPNDPSGGSDPHGGDFGPDFGPSSPGAGHPGTLMRGEGAFAAPDNAHYAQYIL